MKTNKKKRVLILGSIAIILVLIGIGGKIYMDNQAKQEQLKKNLAESKKEIIELLEWNYNDIHSVTFDYEAPKGNYYPVEFDKSLSTTPAGGLSIEGYVNDDKSLGFWAQLNADTMKLDGSSDGYPMLANKLYKNPNPLPLTASGTTSPSNYYLTLSDISALKKEGFTKNITFDQIKKYFEEKLK